MKNVLLVLLLVGAVAGCADTGAKSTEKSLQPTAAAQRAEAVGASGEAPAAPAPVKLDDAPVDPTPATAGPNAPAADPVAYREVTIPAGTLLSVALQSSVGSDTSRVEDPVRGTLQRAVTIGGVTALPAGTTLTGHVTDAARSARVKGRGRVAFRFNAIDLPGAGGRMAIRTGAVARVAPGTKKQDAAKIGVGAAGGAIVGGLLGGGDGAAKGAAIGGGAGTAVVLSTRGKEVRVGPGTPLRIKLLAPLTVRIRQ